MSQTKIDAPGGFVPQVAISYGANAAAPNAVDQGNPLPVQAGFAPATATPVSGNATASGAIGPFAPDLGRPIWVTLSGTWSGTVTVQRSTDGGATLRPLTIAGGAWGVFTANAQEAVGEESVTGATWWLVFQRSSGTLSYEVRQ
jgi:hypothetical protein